MLDEAYTKEIESDINNKNIIDNQKEIYNI